MKAYHWRNLIAERDRLKRLSMGEPAPDAPPVQVTPMPPKAKTPIESRPVNAIVAGRPICMECAHYSERFCTNPQARNPVTGQPTEAAAARKDRFSCGPSGHFWTLRPAPPQRSRAPRDNSEPMEYVPPVPVRRLEVFRDEQIVSLWDVAMRPDCA